MTIRLYFDIYKKYSQNHSARLAQSVERGTFNPEVKGSSPLSGENFKMPFIRTRTILYIPKYIIRFRLDANLF